MMKYKIGDHVLIVENTSQISEVTIIGISGGLYTVRFNTERPSAIRVKEHRLFSTQEEAQEFLKKNNYFTRQF